MRLLIDTHILIWYAQTPETLAVNQRQALEASEEVLVSVASIWEMQIKVQLSKLNLSLPLPQFVAEQVRLNDYEILPITTAHVFGLGSLPFHHKDPFDRLLIAQAIAENATLVSADPIVDRYPVKILRPT